MFLQGIFQKWKVQWGQEFLLTRKEVGGINLFSNDHCIANDDNNKLFKFQNYQKLNLEQSQKEIALLYLLQQSGWKKFWEKMFKNLVILKFFRSRLIHSFIRSLVHPFILPLTTWYTFTIHNKFAVYQRCQTLLSIIYVANASQNGNGKESYVEAAEWTI